MSSLVLINKETGENIIIDKETSWELRSKWEGEHIGKFKFDDLGIASAMPQEYNPVKSEEEVIDNGEYIQLLNNRYTKVYERPIFSQISYADVWLDLITHLDFWTNAIYKQWLDNGRRIYARTKQDLINLTGISQAKFYRFYKDIYDRNYIARWSSKKIGEVFVLNPKYIANGSKIFSEVYYLFNPDDIPNDV